METNQSTSDQNSTNEENQISQTSSNNRLFVAISISVLLTTVIVGLAVYFWQNSVYKKEINIKREITTSQGTGEQISNLAKINSAIVNPTPLDQPSHKCPVQEPEDLILDSPAKLSKNIQENMYCGNYINIPNTDLMVKIPATYNNKSSSQDVFIGLTPIADYKKEIPKIIKDVGDCNQIGSSYKLAPYINEDYCKPLEEKYGFISHYVYGNENNFFFNVVDTEESPREWLKNRILFQGQPWDESFSGGWVEVGDYKYFSLQIACCGGYELIYVYPYLSTDKQEKLVIFGTNNFYGNVEFRTENPKINKNIVLDEILKTLKKVE